MSRTHFDAQIGRLIVLRGWPDDVEEYFSVLSDVPEDLFTAACDHALKTRTWFPVPAELRMDVDAARVARPTVTAFAGGNMRDLAEPKVLELKNPFGGPPLRIPITREWVPDCETCSDTGWASRRCEGHQCGRRQEHYAHEFVEKCACIDWNPTIRRHREAQAKYAKAPAKDAQ